MKTATLWTVLGVIAAIVIAWVLVNVLFSVLGFLFKLLIVAVVAFVVFLILRGLFVSSGDD